ncbi:ribonuclease H2 complex subunit Rnh201 [Schizosaccharomyces japonicus yFS275]|uniref:Ribonuclease n=1 Tax=Schizosaccharomyces japonicus (strain yFS275 / FY16936) TaxID=402676 RepID=B6JZJ9_SCHJY|nr:ribonuclease H2 complex subunit Rnh201 [Schizosaccharomyces japonicus yFS275]EEB06967.1 ribonuclease H2 complex subunit Rnh201 [Schizosaccharomyces japonicus yFS275]
MVKKNEKGSDELRTAVEPTAINKVGDVFLPPSLSVKESNDLHTYTFRADVDDSVSRTQPFVLGVDEAGRGPVLGPMVYAVAFCPTELKLSEYGFADSKQLTAEKRTQLLQAVCDRNNPASTSIGWATTVMTARDISRGMLRRVDKYNLNAQAHDSTIALIQSVLKAGYNISEIYVDTVGPPAVYQAKLQNRFPQAKVTVTKKADSLFPIVSLASICAKVTRDAHLERTREALDIDNWGCGYSSDSQTTAWLRKNVHPVFGWKGHVVRYSWQTAKNLLEIGKNGMVDMDWHDEQDKQSVITMHKTTTDGRSWFGSSGNLFGA